MSSVARPGPATSPFRIGRVAGPHHPALTACRKQGAGETPGKTFLAEPGGKTWSLMPFQGLGLGHFKGMRPCFCNFLTIANISEKFSSMA